MGGELASRLSALPQMLYVVWDFSDFTKMFLILDSYGSHLVKN